MTADREHAPQYTPPADDYAWARCACGHLIYDGQTSPECRFCPCTDHRAPGVCPCGHARHGDQPCPRTACGCRTSEREVAA